MNRSNDYFISSTLRKYLIPTILAILATTAVSFINTMIAGSFLGKEALTSMNIMSSFTFLFAMFGCFISIGAGICASVDMGKGNEKRAGKFEAYAFVASLVMPIAMSLIILPFFKQFMALLGAEGRLYEYMREYALLMLIFGFLTTLMYFPFNFLRLDGRAKTSMLVYALMGIVDVFLLLIFMHAGFALAGVALATIISTAVADAVGVILLLFSKKRQISPVRVAGREILALNALVFRRGAAAGLNNLFNMLRTMALNALVIKILGGEEAGIFAVACSLISLASASVFGCGQTISPLVGVFFGERDNESIRILMKKTIVYGAAIHIIFFGFVLIFAPGIAQIFGISDPDMVIGTANALRWAALSLIPSCVLNIFIYYYMAIGAGRMALILTFLRAFGFVVGICLVLFSIGAGAYYMISFVLAEILGFIVMYYMCRAKNKRSNTKRSLLMLDESQNAGKSLAFSVPGNKEGAVEASRRMEEFCDENDVSPKFAMMLPLALEELLVIIAEHCLGGDEKKYADVRIFSYNNDVILRIRCGGVDFDPMEWYDKRQKTLSKEELMDDDTLGIQLIQKKAKEIMYRRTLGANNLVVRL